MAGAGSGSDGFLDSVTRVFALLRASLQNRTELFSVELQQERRALFALLMMGGCVCLLGGVTLILASGLLIFLFAEAYRLYAAAGLVAVYCAIIVVLWRRIQLLLRRAPFDETIGQLRKDMECLKPPE